MAHIELGQMSDHDLLVVAVTKLNGMDEKLGRLCERVETQDSKLTSLKAEHDMRMEMGTCDVPPYRSRRAITQGGIGGIIGAALITALNYVFGRSI